MDECKHAHVELNSYDEEYVCLDCLETLKEYDWMKMVIGRNFKGVEDSIDCLITFAKSKYPDSEEYMTMTEEQYVVTLLHLYMGHLYNLLPANQIKHFSVVEPM